MALLVSLDKFKTALGITTNADDDRWLDALEDASQAILNYTDRDFGADNVTEDRVYQYNGRGILEIDDCSDINSVTITSQLLTTASYRAGFEGPVTGMIDYIELPTFSSLDGEMGFEYNLDVFLLQGVGIRTVAVTVNADWGWETIPDDVQRAAIWSASSFASDVLTLPQGTLTSRSVAEVSESYAIQAAIQAQTLSGEESLPTRVRGLLAPYRRMTMP